MEQRKTTIPLREVAPDFTTSDELGRKVQLANFRGKKRVVLVFYPGDNTSLCTTQLCAMRDAWNGFEATDTLVFGVNPARAEKHQGFANKHAFPFPLIVDQGGHVAALYGCKGLFGIIQRTVYIIDRQGRVAYVQRGNPPPNDLLRVLSTLQDIA